MPELKLTRERFQDATNIIIQFLRDSGYEGSLEDGTGLNDIVVKPNALLRALMAQMVDRACAYQSLQKAEELKDEIGDTEYNAAVDCILSNWFVSRRGGTPSKGVIRLWFMQPPDFVHFQDGESLGRVDGVAIVADGEQVFSPDKFSLIVNTTENNNEYYVDVAARTRDNSDINPQEDSDARVEYAFEDIYYLRATIPGDFSAGTLIESSEDFIRRTKEAITTRELITSRAINTVLMDNFSEILNVYVARHGSSEQLRDIVHFEDVDVHVGNKADIYISSTPMRIHMEVMADENGNIDIAQLPAGTSVIAFISARDASGNLLEMNIECEETHWCSRSYRPETLSVNANGPITLELLTDTALGLVHDFVYSEEQRVACYDPLVKHKFPLLLYPILKVHLTDAKIDSTSEIKSAVIEYLDYTVANGEPWVASELVASVHVRVPNVKKIWLPFECLGYIYDPLTQQTHEIIVGNTFSIDSDYAQAHSKQISGNTVQFYTDKDMITVMSDYSRA